MCVSRWFRSGLIHVESMVILIFICGASPTASSSCIHRAMVRPRCLIVTPTDVTVFQSDVGILTQPRHKPNFWALFAWSSMSVVPVEECACNH